MLQIQRGTATGGLSDRGLEPISFPTVDQYACQVDDFCASIQAGRLQAPAENGVANMKVLEAALQNARIRR